MNRRGQQGFTLIELAVVVVVIGLLLTGILVPLSVQVETARIQETQRKLAEIRSALIGFAQANGRLPCPATHLTAGEALPVNGVAGIEGCDDGGTLRQHGFVPAVTLGVSGPFNGDNLLEDAWGNPYRYSVTGSNAGGTAGWDFVADGEMRVVGLGNLVPDLIICTASAAQAPDDPPGDTGTTACRNAADELTAEAPVVFYSLGPDGGNMSGYNTQSMFQLENTGERDTLFESLGGYWVASDNVFVTGPRRGEPDSAAEPYFDDLVEWISPVLLYERMIAAGRLP